VASSHLVQDGGPVAGPYEDGDKPKSTITIS
jgi:hypothetical protein